MDGKGEYLSRYADIFTDSGLNSANWVYPGDRHLILRSQLSIGWSSQSHYSMDLPKSCAISIDEQEQIRLVLERAQARDNDNEQRLTRLVDRLQNMKRQTLGNGTTHCLHCGVELGWFVPWSSAGKCSNCKKSVCRNTCGVEVSDRGSNKIFLCNICSEEREVLKKTKACYYNKGTYSAHSATNSPSPLSPQISQRHTQSCSGQSSPRNSPISSRSSSPRRRLPEPPVGSGSSRPGTPTGTPTITESSSSYFRPHWTDEPGAKPRQRSRGSRDSDSVSENEYRSSKQSSAEHHYKTERGGDSDADRSESPEVGRYESVNDSDSVTGADSCPSTTAGEHMTTTDASDSYSMDSGVAPSDRSGRYLSTNTSLGSPSPAFGQTVQRIDKTDDQDKGVKPSTSNNQMARAISPQFSGLTIGKRATGSTAERAPVSPIQPKVEAPAGSTAPTNTAILSGSNSLEGSSSKPPAPGSLSLSQESGMDDQLSSSPDDDTSSLGTLEFSLLYDAKAQTLTVHVVKAQNLRSMDPNGYSDPYVKLHVLPGATKSTQLRTKTITKNLNPEWNETLVYYGLDENEVLKKTLRLSVLDEDTFGHDFLGETRVELKRLSSGRERKFNVYLEKQFPIGKGEAAPQSRGKIMISLAYVSSKSQLVVGIVRCAELIGMDPNGYSDPYVKVHLKPDKKLKFKTPIKKRTCNPEFNCEFNISCSIADLLSKKTLEITVLDKDIGKHDDYIGGLQLGCSAKGEALRHWTACLKNPDQRTERWHRLTDEQFD